MLTWPEVAGALAPSRNYWLGTTSRDGSPHAAPVWGVVLDEVLYLFTESDSVKALNLAADPRLVLHLESGDDVLIVRGSAELLGRPGDLPAIVAAFAGKYTEPDDLQYVPTATDVLNVIYAVRPRSAMVWLIDEYETSQRRWVAPTVIDASS